MQLSSAPPPTITFETQGTTVTMALPKPQSTNIPSVFLLGLPKAGSTLMNNIMPPLCQSAGLTSYAITQQLRQLGIAPKNYPAEARNLFVPHGYAYTGFRGYRFPFRVPDFASGRTIVLVRDPRDMVVSLYYSIAESHSMPGAEASDELLKQFQQQREAAKSSNIAGFVRDKAQAVANNFRNLERRLKGIDHKVWRYEDIIFDKLRWTREMINYLDLDVSEKLMKELVAENDIKPEAEATGEHIRKVTPGDHREKLDPATIDALNEAFKPILDTYNYT